MAERAAPPGAPLGLPAASPQTGALAAVSDAFFETDLQGRLLVVPSVLRRYAADPRLFDRDFDGAVRVLTSK